MAKKHLARSTIWFCCVLLAILLAGCNLLQTEQPIATEPILPATPVDATLAAQVKQTAQAYLDAWKAEQYPSMYALLTSISHDAINEQEFTVHYQGVAKEAALSGIDYAILSVLANADSAQVSYQVVLHSALVGDISAVTVMSLSLDKGQWRIQWDDTLVLPQLKGSNYLLMDTQDYVPSRANIYDRNGNAIVAQTDATALGLYPDQIKPEQEPVLFAALEELIGLSKETIQARYANFPPGQGWYLPLGEVSADVIANRYSELSQLSGLVMRPYKSRYYFDKGVAPQVIGYVSPIPAEEVAEYERQGYQPDERVGRSGLEKWGEPYLLGKRGGALFVYNGQGQLVTRLAEIPAQPSQAIYTTLDRDFQIAAQQALGAFRGAIVVLERDTGRVLAMVSSPTFDPNAFEPINFNSDELLAEINRQDQPLLNRAAQGQYPLGSVFKIITTAAALESGRYTPNTSYFCGQTFTEIPNAVLYDWTYQYGLPASGQLTLPQGLIRSCNPFFYHIGLDLYKHDLLTAVSDMAGGFGLGKLTGIEQIDELPGQVKPPTTMIDATNSAIGQGDLLVNPLQVADFIAAIGNGGTLYRPQLVEQIVPPDGTPTFTFKPEVRAKLPIQAATLEVIQKALIGVVSSVKPRGTAYHVFLGLDIPVAGKTGTAQSGYGLPHAWFAGYTYAGQADKPDIAVAVVVENIGEGSDYAAPIFRRIVEIYFRGLPGKLYNWESTYNVTNTPAPAAPATETPTP